MVRTVAPVTVKLCRLALKSGAVDSSNLKLATAGLPFHETGYAFVERLVGGAVSAGVVAAQFTVTVAAALLALPQPLETLTQNCTVPMVLIGAPFRTGDVAPEIGFVSTPDAPMNHW